MASEETLRSAAALKYGQQRADELAGKLAEVAGWLDIVAQQPLDLLDEEPDSNGD